MLSSLSSANFSFNCYFFFDSSLFFISFVCQEIKQQEIIENNEKKTFNWFRSKHIQSERKKFRTTFERKLILNWKRNVFRSQMEIMV
jgi:hypothetical protein